LRDRETTSLSLRLHVSDPSNSLSFTPSIRLRRRVANSIPEAHQAGPETAMPDNN